MGILERVRQELFPPKDEFDRIHGTNTSGITSLRRLRIASPNKAEGVRHQAVDPDLFRKGVKRVPGPAGFAFVDLGCGKGRGLLLAALEGFENLTGVEFSPALARVARKNLKKMRLRGEVVVGDAATYVFRDEPTVVYMYNPFGKTVLRGVVEQIRRVRAPLYVVYVNPVHAEQFDGFEAVMKDPDVMVMQRRS
jgi:SAM-dependent methyltransferase